jgi:hypothetical protein
LLATVKAIHKKEDRSNKFNAAIQGVDLSEKVEQDKNENDITGLKGYKAAEAGFGIDLGLGYVEEI